MNKKILLAGLVFLASTSSAWSVETIRFGAGLPLPGELASYGEDIKTGINLATEDINAKGGVLGRIFKPIYEDSACDPKLSVAVANHFITQNVDAVTEICSSACLPAAPLYAEEGMPFITQCSTEQITNKGWTNVFRAFPGNNQEIPKLGALLTQLMPAHRKLALVYGSQEFDTNMFNGIQAYLKDRGVKPAFIYNVVGNVTDYSSLITKLKEQKIDLVYVGLFTKGAGLFIRQSYDAGYHPQFVSSQMVVGVVDARLIAGDKAMDGLIGTNAPNPEQVPTAQHVINTLKTRKISYTNYTVYGYLLAEVYAKAVEKAGTADKAKVNAVLRSNTFPTIMGPIAFTPQGDMTGLEFGYYQFRKNEFVPWTQH